MYQYVTSSMYGHATCSGHLLCQTEHSMLFTLTIMTQACNMFRPLAVSDRTQHAVHSDNHDIGMHSGHKV